MTASALTIADRNLLLQIERNVVTPFDPGDVARLVQAGLIEQLNDFWVLTKLGRLEINGTVAQEWMSFMRSGPKLRAGG